MDTQWPRFEVFKQDTPNQTFQNVGTVHAADAELALLNARDVFGRRPSCHCLWVVPEKALLKVTAEELGNPELKNRLTTLAAGSNQAKTQTFSIFQKLSQKRSMIFVNYRGEVQAVSPQAALAQALEQYEQTAEVWVWWVCPTAAITSSEPDVEASWFAPATDKVYRQQSYYGKVKRKRLDERLQIAQQMAQPESETEVAQ